MNTPAKHFKPQNRRAQLRVVQAINAAEREMIPPGFNAKAVALEHLHFQSNTTPLAHEPGAINRLQTQVNNSAATAAATVAKVKAKTPSQQSVTPEPLLLDDGIPVLRRVHTPPSAPMPAHNQQDTLGDRIRANYAANRSSERRATAFVVIAYLIAAISVLALTLLPNN